LTGSELTSWGIVHPTLWKLEQREQVRAEKLHTVRILLDSAGFLLITLAAVRA
jgi:hypothetical protein